ncbi:MAG TPA: hypothetical protein VNZ64_17145 [Candidatus Acidoferrum sp.]|jgi:hypothetical protein|nr:hypothetical protein [Candidatus Acidoferrum sp.]
MEALLYFACVAVVTASVTALICRTLWAHRNKVSFTAAMSGAVISILICYFGSLLFDFGADVFTAKFWGDPKASRNLLFYLLVTAVPSTLVALAVVVYHRHRRQREHEVA